MTIIGSLCAGYGGLDLAVHAVLGGKLAWVADIDPGAAKILAHRFPGVPNLGDITAVDWSAVEPVDVLTAGFPCQPVSAAGRRKGVRDERWLFDDICTAIGRMVTRPRLLVLENVPGLLSANGGDAMARVVQGLAALGYEFTYRLVRASDAGAPHRRERWFCLAWLAADADQGDGAERPARGREPGRRLAGSGEVSPDAERDGPQGDRPATGPGTGRPAAASIGRGSADSGRPAAHPDSPTRGQRRLPAPRQEEGGRSRADAGGRGGAPAADARGAGLEVGAVEPDRDERQAAERGRGDDAPADPAGDARSLGDGNDVRPRRGADGRGQAAGGSPAADAECGGCDRRPKGPGGGSAGRAAARRDSSAAADAGSARLGEHPRESPPQEAGPFPSDEPSGDRGLRPALDWGPYGPAIRRWEAVTGRPAPRPTEPGRTGERLSPRFVEWMQGLPEGWVTDIPGLSRNAMLKALGNGVVPAQAELALRLLLARAGFTGTEAAA